jgi:hypothetical protein
MEHSCKAWHFDSLAKCKEIVIYIIAKFIAVGKKKKNVSLRRNVSK